MGVVRERTGRAIGLRVEWSSVRSLLTIYKTLTSQSTGYNQGSGTPS